MTDRIARTAAEAAGRASTLQAEALLKAGALQNAIFNSANFSSIATDARGVIQIFNVGAERMLGYTAAEVRNTITPADITDVNEQMIVLTGCTRDELIGAPFRNYFTAMPRDVARGLAAGFFRYLTKPVRIPEFLETLDAAPGLAAERPEATPARRGLA